MGSSFQKNYETELAISNLIPTRVIMSQQIESTAENPMRCAPRFMPGSGTNFPYNIYEKDWTRGPAYFQRDVADRRNWSYDFLVTRYVSQKDGKTYVVEHVPNSNVPGRFGWNTWNTRVGEAGIPIQGSYGCPPGCGKQLLDKWTPNWYVPGCNP
ncbi:hypothetical protein [Brazilian marseillevirus]|uniref:hypothetical protein n=1 Tax=Brazilian marseillevirus TaxID=1813599 RepID=UPI0007810741|nr:hypothetical protein A3303_gp491 [Brazilian marseillevirus]AMQ10999.1 hypothetical protein [Brazilian marseillevirus]